MELNQILKEALEKKASDIHLKAGSPPMIRVYGKLQALNSEYSRMTANQLDEIIDSHISIEQKKIFKQQKDLDLSLGLTGLGRFRLSLTLQRGTIRLVIRSISQNVPSIDDLNLPQVLKKIAQFERGLILVTGVTGSGKSSTIASVIDHINYNKNKHIITIEDPIEYLIRDKNSIITQREIGTDTLSFESALRASLRQDPDVIFIGEMRDKETIETALMAAETGHLVLSTLHTLDATETINRILMFFEPHQQMQIRNQLSSVLKAIISQRLAKKKDLSGFIPAVEVLINNTRTKDMIARPERTSELIAAINESHNTYQMQSFDFSLIQLLQQNAISLDEALSLSTRPEDLRIRYSGVVQGHTANIVNMATNAPPLPKSNDIVLEKDETELNKMIDEDTNFNFLKRKKTKS